MKKYIISSIVSGIFVDYLTGDEKIITDIEEFIDMLKDAKNFEILAIEYSKENFAAIKNAGY